LLAIGATPEQARSSVRLTLGKDNTAREIERTLDVLEETVARLRKLAGARSR
jgi:cysteine desulfurase